MEDTKFVQRLGKEQGKETNVGITSSITLRRLRLTGRIEENPDLIVSSY